MSTPRQIEANRKNAQKSTGPQTPDGRAAVRLNGLKHGLNSRQLVLAHEKMSDFHELLDSLEAEHAPATPTEELLVREMAMAAWRLRRLYHMEAGFFALRLIDLAEDAEEDYDNLDDSARLGMVAYCDATGGSAMSNLSRCEARLERSFHRALRELLRLRAGRTQNLQNQTQLPAPAPPLPAPILVETPVAPPLAARSHPVAATYSPPEREIDRL